MPLPKRLRFLFAILAVLGLASCASTGSSKPRNKNYVPLLPGMTAGNPNKKTHSTAPKPTPTPEPEVAADDPADETEENSAEKEPITAPSVETVPQEEGLGQVDEDEEDVVIRPKKKAASEIPHEFNENVASWIQYFSQKDRERFQRFLDRGEPYREAVENILEENKVPADLFYLGLIESGFNFRAASRVKATGVWQFMKGTGKQYGLAVDSYFDERRDPIRATEAAARYLRDLYREFKSWYLAMAAYNAGPGRIRGCIRRAGTDDFWELVEKNALPRETMEYIPKFLAARFIGENPELFAFYVNEEQKYPNVELVKVPAPVRFESIEKVAGIPQGTLAFVNPHYAKDFTHPGKATDEIWVPEKYSAAVEKQFHTLASMKIVVKPEKRTRVAATREKIIVHIVKKGDTLKSIASKRGLSVAYLRRVNNLASNAKLVPGQRLKLSASSYVQKRSHPRKTQRHKKR